MTTPERPTEPWSPADAQPESEAPAFEAPPTALPAAPVAARLPITPARKPAGPSSRIVNLVLGLAAIVAIGGIAFAAGRMTAPVATAAGNGDGNGRFGNGQFPGGGNFNPGGGTGGTGGNGGGGFLRGSSVLEGTVVSSTSTSVTLEISGGIGGQKIQVEIPLSSTTAVHTQADASAGDIAAGQKVLVQLGTAGAVATAGPIASGAPREIQAPASDITIVSP